MPPLEVRPVRYRDLEAVLALLPPDEAGEAGGRPVQQWLDRLRRRFWLAKLAQFFSHPWHYQLAAQVAEREGQLQGLIQVSPINARRSAWQVDRVLVLPSGMEDLSRGETGSLLLRHCFQLVWEARTWIAEVDVSYPSALALYRQNGFQPLAQITYWQIPPEQLVELARGEPDLPNLLPVSNADASLLYQLDIAAMPPLVRQVFDRDMADFQRGILRSLVDQVQQQLNHQEVFQGYVFEPQRKAAIGYFRLVACRHGGEPHQAQLTVHPAYTWLYPEMLAHMARLAQRFPPQGIHLTSSDYQPEREAYLEQQGAQRRHHTLLMSRSVWHKIRESRSLSLDGLQLSEVLQSFQPTQQPMPGRFCPPGPQEHASHCHPHR